jgi:hypothetical protein
VQVVEVGDFGIFCWRFKGGTCLYVVDKLSVAFLRKVLSDDFAVGATGSQFDFLLGLVDKDEKKKSGSLDLTGGV